MDGVERALGGAQTAADTLVGVDDRGATTQAAGGLGAHLLFGKGLDVLAKRRGLLAPAVHVGDLAARVVVALDHDIVAVERGVAALVAADGERGSRLHKAMDGDGGLVTGGDGIDGKARTGVDIAAHKDVGLGGLVGLGIGKGTPAAAKLHLGASQQVAPHNGLANRHDDAVGIDTAQIVLVVFGRKPALVVKDTRAALEGDTAHTTGLVQVNLLGAPAAADVRAVLNGLATLLLAGGHLGLALQTEHLNVLGTQTAGVARDIDGHVAAAHHDGAAGQRVDLAAVDLAQKVDGHGHVLGILARNTGKAAALAADSHVEGLKALLAQLVERHIATDLHAIAELGTHQANDLDLGLDNILLQLKAGNTVSEHTARALVLLEHDGPVALLGQIEGTRQAGRAGTDNGDLLVEAAGTRRGHNRWDIAGRGIQIALGDELLDLIDSHGGVHTAAGAGILTAAVAHTAADSGQRVLALNECQGLVIAALRRELQIALNGDMRGAGRLTGSGAGLMRLDAVVVAVVGRPLGVVPLGGIGQLLARILGHLSAGLFAAELLAQLGGAGRTHLNAATAGHALVLLDLGDIGRARQVGRVEQLRGAQGIAHVDVAVADGEDLVLAVNVGDLMHKAVVLGLAQDVVDLVAGHIMTAVGLDHVVGHIAHGDAPIGRVVGAALSHHATARAAAAGAGGILALVLVEPVLDMLNRHRRARGIDGLLDRNDMHADAGASGRHHRRRLGQRALGRLLKELSIDRMLLELANAHVEELGGTRHQHGQDPLLGALGVFPVVLEQTRIAHVVEHLLDIGLGHAGELDHLGQRVGTAHLHLAEHFGLLVGRGLGKRPVLVAQQLVAVQQAVGAALAQFDDGLARMLRQRWYKLRADIGLGVANPRSVENHGCPFSCHSPARPRHPSFFAGRACPHAVHLPLLTLCQK